MKKFVLVTVVSSLLVACSAEVYSKKGNATILSSRYVSDDKVELVVVNDKNESFTIVRPYDAHATVGSRVYLTHDEQKTELETIRRYEFK